MQRKKIIFVASCLVMAGFIFNFGAPTAKAMTAAEIQVLIQSLQQQIAQLQKQLAETQEKPVWCYDFNTNLKIGDSGSEVTALQTALTKDGSTTWEYKGYDGVFDEMTAGEVVAFQEKYASEILSPWGLKHGTGYVGKSTRAKLNKLYGCAATAAPSITVISPNGGEEWQIGKTYNITWNHTGVSTVNILLYNKFGTQQATIVSNLANDGADSWTIPPTIVPGLYKIYIYWESNVKDQKADDYSDNYFSIVAAAATTVGSLSLSLAVDTPASQIVAVGSSGLSDFAFTKVNLTANGESIDIQSFTIKRDGVISSDSDFGAISLWDGVTQIGVDGYLVNREITFNLPAGSYWRILKNVFKTLTIKADINGIKTQYTTGSTSGNNSSLKLTNINAVGVESGSYNIGGGGSVNIGGNDMILRKSKPTIASASLPSTVRGAGERILYRWTVSADAKGDIGWKKTVFDNSGSIQIGTDNHIIGYGGGVLTDGVYMATCATCPAKKLISHLKVYNVATGDEILGNVAVENLSLGGARINFVSSGEQIIAASQTETYELRGDVLYGGKSGDVIMTKIADRSTSIVTGSYSNIAASAATLVWTDRSATSHSETASDWTNGYKVPGIPTATLSLNGGGTTPTPSITVTSPNGGEKWTAGQSYSIKVNFQNFTYTKADIILMGYDISENAIFTKDDPYSTALVIIRDVNIVSSFVYYWTIPSDLGNKFLSSPAKYKIKVISGPSAMPVYYDYSDNYFSIVAAAALTPSPCGTFGDVNGDGSVKNDDATLISQYLAGTASLSDSQKVKADVNADGIVDVVDSLKIAQYAAGSINTFPACTAPAFKVSFPSAGLSLTKGASYSLSWTGSNPGVSSYSVYLIGGALGSNVKFLGTAPEPQKTFAWTISSDITAGSNYQIQFSGYGASGGNSASFSIVEAPAAITFCDNYGDIDEDGKLSITDSLFISQYINGVRTLTDEQKLRADVDQDGAITNTDSSHISQYLAGSRTTLVACSKQAPCSSYGDANGNGYVNRRDADLITKDLAKIRPLSNEEKTRADVDGNGSITVVDSLKIAQYAAGSINTFPVCIAMGLESVGNQLAAISQAIAEILEVIAKIIR